MSTPVQVTGLTGVIAIAAANDVSYALQTDGAGGGIVWAWGKNNYGQLGDGSTLSRSTPVRVSGLPGVTAIAASFDSQFAIALASNGQVWAWGANDEGQLGNGTVPNGTTPAVVSTISTARMIAAGSLYALAIDRTARVG